MADMRAMVRTGGGGKAGNRDKDDATSGGAATFHIPFLETPAAGPSARVRPRVTNGSGDKAGDQSNVEDSRLGIGICHGQSGKYAACNTAGGGPTDEHAFGGAMTSDRR